jgi:hypothetical protein
LINCSGGQLIVRSEVLINQPIDKNSEITENLAKVLGKLGKREGISESRKN